jgi:hypothetical protein
MRSAILVPPAAVALTFAYAAMQLHPPAVDAARVCVACGGWLLLVNLVAWVARDGGRFGREERLCAFAIFAAVLMGYYLSRQAIAERQFDDIVETQQRELADSASDLSREIIAYVDGRSRLAPARPHDPETWERDESAWMTFERESVAGYALRFARRVRAARAALTFRNLRDRDLDAVYQQPGNTFQIRIIGERLGALADRLNRAIRPQESHADRAVSR